MKSDPGASDTCARQVRLGKPNFVSGYRRGIYGNRAPTWNTLEEFLESGYKGLVHLRNRVAAGPTWYNVPADEVEETYFEITTTFGRTHAVEQPQNIYFSGMAPHHYNTIQGEVRESENHYDLTYTNVVGLPMRDALAKRTLCAAGVVARCILEQYMDGNSYSWLQQLLSTYRYSVVEFSCFSREWGTIRGHNTVFWEVRKTY